MEQRLLKPGETIDGMGKYCYRGSSNLVAMAKKENLLPLGLAQRYRARKDVKAHMVLAYDRVEAIEDSPLRRPGRLRDALWED